MKLALAALTLAGLVASACQLDTTSGGIGTSPSYDDDPAPARAQPAATIAPCGLWIAPTLGLAEERALTHPKEPDLEQFPRPGGLSCSSLIAAQPAVEASYVGASVVRYLP